MLSAVLVLSLVAVPAYADSQISDLIYGALNADYESEWKFAAGETERESSAELTARLAAEFCDKWSLGIKLNNNKAYPGRNGLKGQEYNGLPLGPNVSFHNEQFGGVFAILSRIWGNGEGSLGGLGV